MDTVAIGIIAVVAVGGLLFGGAKVRQWARSVGRAKAEMKIGELEGDTELHEARRRNAEARAAATAAEASPRRAH